MSPRTRKLVQYVLPTILSQVSFFLFTIIDGIFVGQGIGTDALGAINIVFPFVMLCNALFMLATIGGVTVTAIRLGRGDTEGANLAFRHGMMFTVLFRRRTQLSRILRRRPSAGSWAPTRPITP